MTRRAQSGLLGLIIFLIVLFASKCHSQHLEKLTYQGSVSFKKGWIYIRDNLDSVRYNLEVLAVDTSGRKILVKVLSVDGVGFVSITEFELVYHYNVIEGKKTRSKVYTFRK
jgi:hypothetical protein